MKRTIALIQRIDDTSIDEFEKIVDGRRFLIQWGSYLTKRGMSPHQNHALVFKGIESKRRTSIHYLTHEDFKLLMERGFTVYILQD